MSDIQGPRRDLIEGNNAAARMAEQAEDTAAYREYRLDLKVRALQAELTAAHEERAEWWDIAHSATHDLQNVDAENRALQVRVTELLVVGRYLLGILTYQGTPPRDKERLHKLLSDAPAVAPGAEAGVAETCPDCGHLDHAGRRCRAGCSIWRCSAGWRAVAPGASDAGEGERR